MFRATLGRLLIWTVILAPIICFASNRNVRAQPATEPAKPTSEPRPKSEPESAEPKPSEPTTKAITPPATPASAGSELNLTGLKMTVPAGWVKEEAASGPMAPVAVFKIPKVDPTSDDGAVRITHFPNMKGKEMNDRNIDRWLGQIAKADGQPITRSDAKITEAEIGAVKLIIVDAAGSVKMTMRDAGKPNHRMIAAIVDHPQGPHFVVAAGPAASMEKWAAQIDAFLKSAKSN